MTWPALLHLFASFLVNNQTFSYVIVGGGTAGLTIANRLTQDPQTTVLVIESGSDKRGDARITDPSNSFVAMNAPDLSWGYVTTNQTVGGRSQSFVVGKVLGGSLAINGMQWTRGTIAQYDALEELGNPGWNFASLQEYMKKAEGFHSPNTAQLALNISFNPSAHGAFGSVITGFPNPYPCPFCNLWDALISSSAAVIPGLRTTGIDQCSGDPRGSARCAFSIIPAPSTGVNVGNNIRSSSVQSFIYSLSPSDRPNLNILVEHRATKILWHAPSPGGLPIARGVAFQAQDFPAETFSVTVTKEVIVSSGTLGTPKFLHFSRIGDKMLLEGLGIPVTVDLPAVGTNLQDQTLIPPAFLASQNLNTTVIHVPDAEVTTYLTLPQVLGAQGAASFIQDLASTITKRASDIIATGGRVSQEGVEKMLQTQLQQFGDLQAPVVEVVYGTVSAQVFVTAHWILLPQYRGTVRIASSNPQDPPIINPNYIGTPEDFSLLVNATKLVRAIRTQPAAKAFYSEELSPGVGVQTDEQFSDFVRNNYQPTLHPIGTAAMLPRELGGVVDSNLRVYGVRGVRVADASILPLQLSAHLSSTVYGIAEKASDLIIGQPTGL